MSVFVVIGVILSSPPPQVVDSQITLRLHTESDGPSKAEQFRADARSRTCLIESGVRCGGCRSVGGAGRLALYVPAACGLAF
jgi:hypothetical protein